MIRAEKGTPNENAMKTLLMGAVCSLGILLGVDTALRLYDTHFNSPPWIEVTLEIMPQPVGPPKIKYLADAKFPIDGVWTATIVDEYFGRLATRKGDGDYTPGRGPAKPWPWHAFFEQAGRLAPPEPLIPYRVCVSYRMTLVRSGAKADSAVSCSEIYDPRSDRK